MKALQDGAAFLFIGAIAVLSFVSLLGVWDFFGTDVIQKSYETIGLLAVAAIITIVAAHFIESRQQAEGVIVIQNPLFAPIRRATLMFLIAAASVLAIVGVLAIWDIIRDATISQKVFSSITILAFSAFAIVLACFEREGKIRKEYGLGRSIAAVIALLVVGYLYFSFTGFYLWQ